MWWLESFRLWNFLNGGSKLVRPTLASTWLWKFLNQNWLDFWPKKSINLRKIVSKFEVRCKTKRQKTNNKLLISNETPFQKN